MNKDTYSKLFELSVIGLLANAFYSRKITPSAEQWEILHGQREMSLRELAEIAAELGYSIEFSFVDD